MSFSYFRLSAAGDFQMIKKNIPNLFTLCNLLCGCIAIVFAFEGNLIWSAYMVGIACVFDFLDGMIARALNVYSELGKQLDSLADMVSFGVLPGVMMFQFLQMSIMRNYSEEILNSGGNGYANIDFGIFLLIMPYFGFLVTIFSAVRLAKFNLDTRQTDSFIGLPTPANTIFIVSLLFAFKQMRNWNYYELIREYVMFNQYFYLGLAVISSLLLIAPLPLFALKFKNFSWTDNKVRYIFLALALALLIVFRFAGIPLIIILYIILSVVNNILTRSKTQS